MVADTGADEAPALLVIVIAKLCEQEHLRLYECVVADYMAGLRGRR